MRAPILLVIFAGCDAAHSRASQTIAVGARPIELAAGDLDGDGRPDLAVARADGTVVVYLNGAWRAAGEVRVHAHMLGLGDVDADGKLDLVTTDHDSGDVTLARGRGDGRFGTPEPIRAVTVAKPHNHGLVVADLDGDGDADAVVADQVARQLVMLMSDGRTLVPRPPIALPQQPYPPAAGDLDGDGKLDLVVPLVGDRAIAVLLNKGGGDFTAPRTFATTRPRPYGVVVGDVDGDRRADVVVSHDDTDDVVVMAGNGKGELVEQRALELPCRIGTGPALVDLDGDGALDLVGIGSGRLVIAEGRLARIRSESAGGWRVIATDLDGDRKPDLAAADSDGGVVRLWLGRR